MPFEKGNQVNKTHGKSKTPEYYIWVSMKMRCDNPKQERYPDYGGRGITYCERWKKFENFYADMGSRPTPKHTIERENVNGSYDPDNCIWATDTVQMRNRRDTKFIEFNGERRSVPEWAEVFGIPYNILRQRLFRDKLPLEVCFQAGNLTPRVIVGERPSAKLTDLQVDEIRTRRAAGERRIDLAKEFGVSETQIYNIIYRKQRTRKTGLVQAGFSQPVQSVQATHFPPDGW